MLFDINLAVSPQECLALVGESGSGKTTFARCVAGLHRSFTGEIELHGRPLPAGSRSRDRENALDWLERTCEMRSGLLIWLSVHFHFDVLRQDPRFADLLRRIGLAESNDVSTTTR